MTTRADDIATIAMLMRDLDFCLMTTRSADGLRARPMSNNGEVEFDGDVWFFSAADSRKVGDIEADAEVHLGYADPQRFTFVSMTGRATIVNDRARKREMWLDELARWFPEGPDSDGVVLIKVTPTHVAYWGDSEGEISL